MRSDSDPVSELHPEHLPRRDNIIEEFDMPDAIENSAAPFAPDFALPNVEGRPVRLSDYRGKKHVVLVFNRGTF